MKSCRFETTNDVIDYITKKYRPLNLSNNLLPITLHKQRKDKEEVILVDLEAQINYSKFAMLLQLFLQLKTSLKIKILSTSPHSC